MFYGKNEHRALSNADTKYTVSKMDPDIIDCNFGKD